MKLHILLRRNFIGYGVCLLTCLIHLGVSAQRVTLSLIDVDLEKVFIDIEKQTNIRFIYTRENLAIAKPVTLIVSNETVEHTLELCFKSQPLTYSRVKNHVVIRMPKESDSYLYHLKGKVISIDGLPAAGISIKLSRPEQFAITDSNGVFEFSQFDPSSELILTGAEIEELKIPVEKRNQIVIMVSPRISLLDETIVVGYNKTNRRHAISKVDKVDASTISMQQVSNPVTALSGRVPGLSIRQGSGVPGSYIGVILRGRNSISNGNDPLFILDGVPFQAASPNGKFGGPAGLASSAFDNINPEDIESIEVLKDAASTSIYGSRGANGVILMTSKAGKPGHGFDVNYINGFGAVTRKMSMMDSREYLQMRRQAFTNEKVIPNDVNAPDLLLWDSSRFTDWQDLLIGETMHRNQLSSSLSGGNQLTQFRFSGMAQRESTVYPGEFGRQKYGASLSVSHHDAENKFYFTTRANFVFNKIRTPRVDLVKFIATAPTAPTIFNPDGSLNWENGTWVNPYSSLQQVFTLDTYNLQAALETGYRFKGGVALKLLVGGAATGADELCTLPGSSFDPSANLASQAIYGNRRMSILVAEPQITYQLRKTKYDLDFIMGLTLQQNRQHSLHLWGKGYNSDDQLESINAASISKAISEEANLYRYVGGFARIDINRSKKYVLSMSVRRDGSSRYGPENRFSNFTSTGFAWLFSNEKVVKKIKGLSYGKLSLSLGNSGNDQIGDYKYFDLYRSGNYTYQGLPIFHPTQLYNAGFGWEKVSKRQVGIELGFIGDRILLSSYYYRHLTSNHIVFEPLSAVTGFGGITKNIPSRLLNKGWEFQVNATLIRKAGFSWMMSANITIPRSILLEYPELSYSDYADRLIIGEPLAIRRCFNLIGVDAVSGMYTFRDYNYDGKITDADRQLIVKTDPSYFGGIEQNIVWKNFSLSVFLQFVREKGADPVFSEFVNPGEIGNQPKLVLDRWKQSGDQKNFQRAALRNSEAALAYQQFLQSDGAISNASYLRVQNVYLLYQFPRHVLKRFHLRKLGLFLAAQNLLTITRYIGLDPETKHQTPLIRLISSGIMIGI